LGEVAGVPVVVSPFPVWSSRVRGKNPTVPLPTVKKTGWVEANIQSLLCLSGYACSPELLPEHMSTALHWLVTSAGFEKTFARKVFKK
jgi:hypothetical protein